MTSHDSDQLDLFNAADPLPAPAAPSAAPSSPLPSSGDRARLELVVGHPISDDQFRAITAPLDRSVLLVAGAGAGKTSVMSARVFWLVSSGALRPEEIVGLTFTRKAAGELAARVSKLLSTLELEDAGEPVISTYHSFAQSLVREHGLRIGVEPDMRLIDDIARMELAGEIVRSAGAEIADVYGKSPAALIADVLRLDQEMAEHEVGYEALVQEDRAMIAAVDDLPKLTNALRDVRSASEVRIALVGLVKRFRARKLELGVVDFGDLMRHAATLARQRPEIRADMLARYGAVLLDEYQDTSVVQARILEDLFAPTPGGSEPRLPSVMAVGDPLQSIYGWRGASVSNIVSFAERFASERHPVEQRELSVNVRSLRPVIAAANRLSTTLRTEFADKGLTCPPMRANVGPTDPVLPVTLDRFNTKAQEAEQLVCSVAAQLERGYAPEEIAILFRRNSDMAAVFQLLTEAGIPAHINATLDLLDVPEVAEVMAALRVIADPMANAAALRLLSGSRWRLGNRDLAVLSKRASDLARIGLGERERTAASRLLKAANGADPTELPSLAEAIADPGDPERYPYSADARERLSLISAEWQYLRSLADEPLAELLTAVINETGIAIECAAIPGPGSQARLDNLSYLVDLAGEFADASGRSTLAGFLRWIDVSKATDSTVGAELPLVPGRVQLLTVHRSKGLEYDVVYVPFMSEGAFPSATVRDNPISTAKVLPHSLRGDADAFPELQDLSNKGLEEYKDELKELLLQEESRLAYVAITRARKVLGLSCHVWSTDKKPKPTSRFLDQLVGYAPDSEDQISVNSWSEGDETNPHAEAPDDGPAAWPLDLPRHVRERHERVAALLDGTPPTGRDGASSPADPAEAALIEAWGREVDTVLAELAQARRRRSVGELPRALSASDAVRLANDPAEFAEHLLRPMPRRPSRAARRGTRFHAWVEQHYGQRKLLADVDLPGAEDEDLMADDELEALQRGFAATGYDQLVPHELEVGVAAVFDGQVIEGRIDAVFRDADTGRWDVVDWKTHAKDKADPLQLAIYRLAWADLIGVDPALVDATFVYVARGDVDRLSDLPDREEVARLLHDSQAALSPGSAEGD